MTENAAGRKEPELEAHFFAVGKTPYCVWDWGLRKRNVRYLNDLDPDYFDYVGRANYAYLRTEDLQERRRAATAIRAAYHHGLESFFALLFSALQAPDCVVGWMQAYTPAELRDLVRAVDPTVVKRGDECTRALELRERLPAYMKVRPRLTLEGISEVVNLVPGDDEERAEKVRENFAGLWRRFGRDFVKPVFTDEYNSIKHGLRSSSGGFYATVGLERVPGEPAPAEATHPLGGSEHGSSFFMARTLADNSLGKEKRPRLRGKNREVSFRVRQHRLNWDPEGLCGALRLISASINNVRSFALAMNLQLDALQFRTPADEWFSLSLGRPLDLEYTNLDALVFKGQVDHFDEEQIKQGIEEEAEAWTRRASEINSRQWTTER